MKKSFSALTFLLAFSAYANQPQFNDLTKSDVKDVSKEFGANFAHTTVSAPETNGAWGAEIGLAAGITKSPSFSDVIEDSGGNGSDFKNIYHAGLIARVHLPYDIFAEMSILPEQDISDVKVKSQSLSLGWNLGSFIKLPLDVAIGFDYGKGEVNFSQEQDIPSGTPAADINLETSTSVYWLGVSKTFLFFTPYLKAGVSQIKGDLSATGQILVYSATTNETVNMSGGFLAAGANFQLAFLKLGIEGSQIQDTKRVSAKLSLDF